MALNMELVNALQRTRPNMFSTTPVYDGQKKLYSVDELPVEEIESEVPFFCFRMRDILAYGLFILAVGSHF